jgi:hypothetical protein
MNLPGKLFVREQRDIGDCDCPAFTTKPLPAGERNDCDTDGHYRCKECTRRDPENPIETGQFFWASTTEAK